MGYKPLFCKDCKHVRIGDEYTCASPRIINYNLVTGVCNIEYCASMREQGAICGPSAKLFERKSNASE